MRSAPRLCSGLTIFHDVHGWTWERHSDTSPMYADDTQVYGHCQPDQTEFFSVRISNCVDAISGWMFSSRLQLNVERQQNWGDVVLLRSMWTWILFQIGRHLLRPDPASIICPQPWELARLRLFYDHSHQQNNSFQLWEIRSISAPFSFDVRKLLITSFIISKIDYGNSTTVGLPAYRFEQLQRVINAAAKIINNKRKHDQVTPLLHDLHWLHIY